VSEPIPLQIGLSQKSPAEALGITRWPPAAEAPSSLATRRRKASPMNLHFRLRRSSLDMDEGWKTWLHDLHSAPYRCENWAVIVGPLTCVLKQCRGFWWMPTSIEDVFQERGRGHEKKALLKLPYSYTSRAKIMAFHGSSTILRRQLDTIYVESLHNYWHHKQRGVCAVPLIPSSVGDQRRHADLQRWRSATGVWACFRESQRPSFALE